MAGIRRIYTSVNQQIEDIARSNSVFRETDFLKAQEEGTQNEYLLAMANTRDNLAADFDVSEYDRLSDDDRFNYFVHKNYGEVGSKEYKQTEAYFNQKFQEIKNQEIYEGLNGFEKAINSVGGYVGNAMLQLVGIAEGLIDAPIALGGQVLGAFGLDDVYEASKEFVTQDTTGYTAMQQEMNNYIQAYTFIDKTKVSQGLNDVLTGIVRMTPMLVGNLLAPVTGGASAVIGNTMYYATLYGSSAEELYVKNPDVNWFDAAIYTGGTVGIEALTEWASAKLFGASWFDPVLGESKNPLSTFGKDLWHDVWTEGVEESVSEIFGGMLYQKYIDPTSKTTLSDILYAAIIGGVTGGVLSGGKALFGTTKYAMYDGKVVTVNSLTDEQLKTAKQLGFGKSYEYASRTKAAQEVLEKTTAVANLQAKYSNLSLDQIKTQHADEFQQAEVKDASDTKNDTKIVLGLAKFLSTIGEENFTGAVSALEEHIEQTRQSVENYVNHTDVNNKTAAEVFKKAHPDKSFTPSAQPTESEQLLAKSMREVFPGLKVVFGTFGAKDGTSVASINGTEGYLFIESGLVDAKGFDAVVRESVRNELARELLDDLSILTPEHADALASLITEKPTKYSDLTEKEKIDLAKIICFDKVTNKRLFQRSNKVHANIFKSLTDKADYIKRFGRQTKTNKIRYHDLLEIRNMFLKNIAETIYNNDDVTFVQNEYQLSSDELKTKIIDKTSQTAINRFVKLTQLQQSKETILRKEAYTELSNARIDAAGDFDFARMYDESYYKPEYIEALMQNTKDFKAALDEHLMQTYMTNFASRPAFIKMFKENISDDVVREAGNALLTKEFLDTNPDYDTLVNEVAEQMYLLSVFGTIDPTADSVAIQDSKIEGTGKLGFIDIQLFAKKPTFDSKFVENIQPYVVEDVETEKQVINNTTLYKGVTSEITDDFDNTQGDKKRIVEGATWLTDNIEFAKTYANMQTGGVLTRTVTINNPLVIDAQGRYFSDAVPGITADDLAKYAQERGYDSLIIKNIIDAGPYLTNATDKATRSKPSTDVVIFKNTTATINKEESVKSKSVVDFVNETKNVSKKILQGFAAGSKALSQVQYSESNSKEYYQVSRDMIDTMADTFALVNNENYDQIRKDLENSTEPYAKQALEIFDFYTIEMQGKFNAEIRQKIENQYQKLNTEAGQRLYLQSVRVAERKPISSAISTLQKDGFNVTLTDEMVLKYDTKLKDKDAYIKELESRISDLEKQIKHAKTEIEKTALSKELKDVADKKLVIESGSNADILDYIVRNTSTLEEAAKIQDDVLQKLVSTAIKAQEEGKKVGYYVYDENGELKPFPEASKKLAKTLKKLKSFRMWAMLSSPVTWVRNWMGNQGMRALDGVTNVVEGFMNKRFGGYDQQQMKFTETKGGKELYEHIAKTNESYIMALVRGEDVKYETTAEKAAAIKRQERKIEYDSANTFQKLCLKAQDMTDWGLSTGFLGDEPVVFNSICKNMGNLVANNIDFLLQGIRQEANSLNKKTSLTEKQKTRLDTLEKALNTKNSIDVFNALSKEETERLFDVCKERSFQQYFKNPNALSKWFSKFGTKHPVYAELVSWVMPFPKVAANVLSMAYRYSPLNFFNGLAELSKYKQTQQAGYKGPVTGFERAKAIRAFSEASVGTFMLIAGAIFSAMGFIDIDEDDYLGPSIKIGDFKVSLTNLAPSMTTFSTASAMVWAWKNDKSGVTQALSTLYDNTLLGNVENLLTYGSLTDVGKNAFMSYVSQYIPAILKLVNKTTTGGVKKDKSGTYLQRLIKTLGSYVPGVSSLVPDKIDPYTGEKMYQAGSDNWFLNLLASISPLTIRWDSKSEIQRQAEILGAETTGLSGSFKVNDVDYSVSNKEKYAKYRANYIESQFDNIVKGKQKVTVEDENGKRITTTYDKLNDKQKKNVINRLYTDATSMTKIKWWTDQGNTYVVTDRDQYNEYRKMFSNIIYKKNWSKSKFVES